MATARRAAPAARRAAPARRKGTISVDFTGVEAGGGGRLLPEDRYLFEVKEVNEEEGQDSGQPYLEVQLVVADGEYEGTKAYDNLSLQPQALWKLRGFMEALGLETVDGPMDINPEEFVGMMVECDIIHEDYKGKNKHRVAGYFPAEDTGAETSGAAPAKSNGAGGNGSTVRKRTPEPAAEEADWKLRQRVAFQDGKKRLEGVIVKLDGDSVTVRVGRDEYEMATSDIEAA